MEWISEHLLQIIVALAAAIAAYLNNRKKEKSGEPADFDGDGIPDNRPGQFEPAQMDMDEADRTRRIQEEIRRKIAERRGEAVPPLVAPRPIAQPIPEVIQRRFEHVDVPPPLPRKQPSAAAQAARDEEVLERQRALQEQMRLLEARKAEARRLGGFAESGRCAARVDFARSAWCSSGTEVSAGTRENVRSRVVTSAPGFLPRQGR
jgi:hypothetical protein